MGAYEGENRALDCNYVRNTLPVNEVPDLLLDGHGVTIVDSPGVFLGISAGQVFQIGRDKDTAPCAIVLTTKRKMHICKFLLTATLFGSGWQCHVFKFDNSLAYNWSEND